MVDQKGDLLAGQVEISLDVVLREAAGAAAQLLPGQLLNRLDRRVPADEEALRLSRVGLREPETPSIGRASMPIEMNDIRVVPEAGDLLAPGRRDETRLDAQALRDEFAGIGVVAGHLIGGELILRALRLCQAVRSLDAIRLRRVRRTIESTSVPRESTCASFRSKDHRPRSPCRRLPAPPHRGRADTRPRVAVTPKGRILAVLWLRVWKTRPPHSRDARRSRANSITRRGVRARRCGVSYSPRYGRNCTSQYGRSSRLEFRPDLAASDAGVVAGATARRLRSRLRTRHHGAVDRDPGARAARDRQRDRRRGPLGARALPRVDRVCASLRFATNSTRRAVTSRIGIVIENRLRAKLYDAYLTYPRAFYDRHATGQVLSRATNDLYPIRYFIGWGVVQVCSSAMMIVGVSIVLLA